MRPIETWLDSATAAKSADFGASPERDLGQAPTHEDFASLMEKTLGSLSRNQPGKTAPRQAESPAPKTSARPDTSLPQSQRPQLKGHPQTLAQAESSSPQPRSGKYSKRPVSGGENSNLSRTAVNRDASNPADDHDQASSRQWVPGLSTVLWSGAGEPSAAEPDSQAAQSETIPSTPLPAEDNAPSPTPADSATLPTPANSAISPTPANSATSPAPANSAISPTPANSATSPAPANSAVVVALSVSVPSVAPDVQIPASQSKFFPVSAAPIASALSPAVISDTAGPASRVKRSEPDPETKADAKTDAKTTAEVPAEPGEPARLNLAHDGPMSQPPQASAAPFLADQSHDSADQPDTLASAPTAGDMDLSADATPAGAASVSTDAIDGTGVAFTVLPMKNPDEKNKVAGPAVKVLPVDDQTEAVEKNLPPPMLVAAPRGTDDPGDSLSRNFGGSNDASAVEKNAQILNTFDLPTLTDARMRALERAHDMVSLHSMRLVESKLDMLSVVIKPAVGMELALDLRQQAGSVEAQATLLRGDHQFLNQHWSELQQRLEQRGIKLAALNNDTGSAPNDGGQRQAPQPSQEEAAQQASAFAEFAAGQPGGASARLAPAHEGWEYWA